MTAMKRNSTQDKNNNEKTEQKKSKARSSQDDILIIDMKSTDSDKNQTPTDAKQKDDHDHESDTEKLLQNVEDEPIYEKLRGYWLILWDGPGFFGMDTSKLGRVKGEPVNCCTKC